MILIKLKYDLLTYKKYESKSYSNPTPIPIQTMVFAPYENFDQLNADLATKPFSVFNLNYDSDGKISSLSRNGYEQGGK